MAVILVAANTYFSDHQGGSARLAYDLAQAFASEGHDVWYLCQDVMESHDECETDAQITVLRYRLRGETRYRALFRHLQHMRAGGALLRAYMPTPDIVLGHNPLQYVTARRVWNGTGLWCYCVHSPAVEEMRIVWKSQGVLGRFKYAFGIGAIQRMEDEILGFSDALAVESDYTRKLLSARYGSAKADRCEVIPGWVDPQRFHRSELPTVEARQHLDWPIDLPVFFSLRRLEARMGMDNLLYAYKILVDAGCRFHAIIGGTGSQQSALQDLRDRLGLETSVTFMGRVPDSLLPLAYAACDASVVPTAQLECFGLIALESIACGTPALVTPVGALPDIVKQFQREWIAPSASPQGIATLLQRFLLGALPPVDQTLVQEKMAYYSLSRALTQYRKHLGLSDPSVS